MLFQDVRWVDVRANLAAGQQPVFLLERPLAHGDSSRVPHFSSAEVARLGEYWVPDGLTPGSHDKPGTARWHCVKAGDHVRIPLTAYKCARSSPALVAFAMQIGMAAVAGLRKHTADEPQEAVLILGHEVQDLSTSSPAEEALRFFVGIALRTR